MGRFHCKVFALRELQKSQKFCVHVAVDRLSGSLTRAQGAERSKKLSIQVEKNEGRYQHAKIVWIIA